MKNKGVLIQTTIFFLTLATSYYWEGKLGLFTLPVLVILVIIYFILGFILIRQIYLLVDGKFTSKTRLLNCCIITLALMLTYSKPLTFMKNYFFMEFVDIEKNNVLVAARFCESMQTETFKLTRNASFKEKNTKYGLSEVKGSYRIVNDTIYFEHVKKGKQEDIVYEYGVIEELEIFTENQFALTLHENKNDTIGYQYSFLGDFLNIKPQMKQYD